MAITSIMANPNFNWGTWNAPYSLDDTVDTTEPVDTTSGITSMYPFLTTGGGTGGDAITPIMPRETYPFAFEDIRALAARGATDAQSITNE